MEKPSKIWVGKTIAAAKAVSTLVAIMDEDDMNDVLDVLNDVEYGVNKLYTEGLIDYNTYKEALRIIDETDAMIRYSNPSVDKERVNELMETLVKMLR